MLEVLGETHRLVAARTRLEAGFREDAQLGPVLAAFGSGDAFGRAALRLLKRQALEVLSERTAHYAATLGRPTPRPAGVLAGRRARGSRPTRERSATTGVWCWRPMRWPTTSPPTNAPT